MPALTPLTQDGEDVERPARVDAGDEHRGVAGGAGPFDRLDDGRGRARRVQQRVEGRRHHVGPGLQARDEVGEGGVGPGVGGRGVHDRVDVVGQGDARVVGREPRRAARGTRAHRRRARPWPGSTPPRPPAPGRRAPPPPGSPAGRRCPSPTPRPGTSSAHATTRRDAARSLLRDLLPPLAPPVLAHQDAELRVPAVRDLGGVLQVVQAVLALLARPTGGRAARRSRRGDGARSASFSSISLGSGSGIT